jgi:RNA polymerase sigma factor (sigma-70 family)
MSSAEDLAQETFLRGWQGLARLRDERAFGSWILSTAAFVCREWLRARRRAEPPRAAPESLAPDPAPGRQADAELAEAIAELPPEAQKLLALRHGEGLSCEEIARRLGKPLGTVTKTLSRLHARLRKRLVRRSATTWSGNSTSSTGSWTFPRAAWRRAGGVSPASAPPSSAPRRSCRPPRRSPLWRSSPSFRAQSGRRPRHVPPLLPHPSLAPTTLGRRPRYIRSRIRLPPGRRLP